MNQQEKSNWQSLLSPPSLPISAILSSLNPPTSPITFPSLSSPPPHSSSHPLPPLSDIAGMLREFLKERKGEEGREKFINCTDEELMGKYMFAFIFIVMIIIRNVYYYFFDFYFIFSLFSPPFSQVRILSHFPRFHPTPVTNSAKI